MGNLLKNFLISTITATTVCGLIHASQDRWDGKEYAKNSESQKASAVDFLKKYHFISGESILDIGCGDGKITAAMAKEVGQGTVVGVDISSSMIDFAKKTHQEQKNLTFLVEDASKINYHEQFDLITSFTVLQWVLDQAGALRCFEAALKPNGKVWIQMPTGLPHAMENALAKLCVQDEWKGYFASFSPPWRFYNGEEYRSLLKKTKFNVTRLDVVTKKELFPSREVFHGFLRQWFPYLHPIPTELKDKFLSQLLDLYIEQLPKEENGMVSFTVDRLEVEAIKA